MWGDQTNFGLTYKIEPLIMELSFSSIHNDTQWIM
jgi:hypothetical protein